MNLLEIAEDGYFRFQCPNPKCQKRLKARPCDEGKTTHCPKCGQHTFIPAPNRNSDVDVVPIASASPQSARRSDLKDQNRSPIDETSMPATPPRPRLHRAIVVTGMIAINCTLLLLTALLRLLQIPETEPYYYLVCLGIAALVGGYFATAIADLAKFRQCFTAGIYVLILQFFGTANVIALREAVYGTRLTHRYDLTAVYAEVFHTFCTSWQVIGVAVAGCGAFLVGGMIERAPWQ